MAEPETTVTKSRRRIAFTKAQGLRRLGRDYSRVLRATEWASRVKVARQQSCAADVRFGSKADLLGAVLDVRFTPKSGPYPL